MKSLFLETEKSQIFNDVSLAGFYPSINSIDAVVDMMHPRHLNPCYRDIRMVLNGIPY